jgi:hypothetical protein
VIELQFVDCGIDGLQLQQRTRLPVVDASGAFCGFGEWGEWKAVPVVSAAYEPFPANLIERGAEILKYRARLNREAQ